MRSFIFAAVPVVAYTDVLTHNSGSPVEVINFAIESGISGSRASAERASFIQGKPVIELSIADAHPFTGVADAIASAESHSGFGSDMDSLEAAYKSTLTEASATLGNTIARALGARSSFMGANINEPTISVRVVGGNSDMSAGSSAVSAIEGMEPLVL